MALTLVPAEGQTAHAPGDWLDVWRASAALGWETFAKMAALGDPRKLRDWWLADMRQLTAEALKSPAFLAVMRFNLNLLTRPTLAGPARPFDSLRR